MKTHLAATTLLFTSVLSLVSAKDSFDNFVLSYGDFERCTFGIGRPRTDLSQKSKVNHSKKISHKVHLKETAPVHVQTVSQTGTGQCHPRESRAAQVIHAAEEAFVHALRDEVDTLFNDKDHPHHGAAQVQNVSTSTATSTSADIVKTTRFSRRNRRNLKTNNQKEVIQTTGGVSNRMGWGLEMLY
mmetsp:Transcript_19674/g.24260  ORF Transcript_19674/g.24260 Transcript_19674/m.24260 type:complete len:186 (+) Transcript_19674:116-673(+)